MCPEKILRKVLIVNFAIAFVFTLVSCGPRKPEKPTGVEPSKPEIKVTQPPEIKGTKPPEVSVPKEVVLLLKFTKGQSDTYKSIMETQRSGTFTGAITIDVQFKNATSGTRAEMIFQQQIEDVDSAQNATIKVTVKSLKYLSKTKDVITLDFDSSDTNKSSNPLIRLIGQSYTITMSPRGEVKGVNAGPDIRQAAAGNTAAITLISENIIRKRHQIPPIVDSNSRSLKLADKWSAVQSLSISPLPATIEKFYTLRSIEQKNGARTAIVDITAIPATVQEGVSITSPLTKMFDSSNSITGLMELDLDGGKIKLYSEKTVSESTVADTKTDSTVKMTAMELTSLEKLD